MVWGVAGVYSVSGHMSKIDIDVRVPLALNGAWRRFQVSLAPLYNSIIGNHESFADDLNTQRGTVSARVVLYYDPLRFSPSCLDLVFYLQSPGT